MKIELKPLTIKYLFKFAKAIKNPDVSGRLRYNLKGYLLKGLKEILTRKDSYKFAILANGQFAGGIVLENPNKDKDSYEIGCFVAREYWNKGIATKATKKMLDFGFNKLKLNKIWAGVDINNPASSRVLEKLGFKLRKTNKKEFILEKKRQN
ncbi:MAG: GNAT family N-acetyltransferase [Candidatus Nanoarchaeia archaeon]|nr:GNAT family N-acetyltransferase [Candidatus Nanoarchaeia archaeon]